MALESYAKHARIWGIYSFENDRRDVINFWKNRAEKFGYKVLSGMCAVGEIEAALADTGLSVTGFDFTKEMIDEAQKRYGDKTNLCFEVADIRNLDLCDKDFDFSFVGNGDFPK